MSKNNMLVVTEKRKSTDKEIKFKRRDTGLYESSNGYVIEGNGGTDIWGHPLKADCWYIYPAKDYQKVQNGVNVWGSPVYKTLGECVGTASTLRDAKAIVVKMETLPKEKTFFESALAKLGEDSIEYLEGRNRAWNKAFADDRERLMALNEGRIEGFIRALKFLGTLTDNELTALSLHYPYEIKKEGEQA